MDYEKKLRQEKIRELGEDYAVQLMESNTDVRVDNLDDSSIRQLKDSMAALDRLMLEAQSNDIIPDDIKSKLDEAGLSLEDFKAEMQDTYETAKEKNLSEYFEKVQEALQTALNTISEMGTAISDLGESAEDPALKDLGDHLSGIADKISTILQGLAAGGPAGAIIAAITLVIEHLVSMFSKSAKYTEALRDAAKEYEETMQALNRENYDTIFGTDELGRFISDLQEARKSIDKYNDSLKKAEEDKYSAYRRIQWGGNNYYDTSGHSVIDSLAYVSGLDTSNFYNNGVLDMEKVKAYFEQVGDEIPKKQRKVLEELIENYDYMNEQMGYMDEYLSSLFGNLASDIADAWIESWKNMTDTAEDEAERMKDIFYDLGEAIVQSMVQSLIINTVLEKYTDQLKQLYTQYETSQNIDAFNEGLSSIFSSMKEDLEGLQPVIEDIYDNAEANDIISRDDYNSIDTIQGNLSEETMNRVLNIVNAMRAEQFRQGMRIDNIDVTLVSIAGLLGESRDQYLNYLAQISANTANTAERMQQWLDVWGDATSGSGPSGSLRVRIVN